MKVGYSMRHHVNMGNYESVEFSAWAEKDVVADDVEDAFNDLQFAVSSALEDEMDEAANKSREKNTYIQYWKVAE